MGNEEGKRSGEGEEGGGKVEATSSALSPFKLLLLLPRSSAADHQTELLLTLSPLDTDRRFSSPLPHQCFTWVPSPLLVTFTAWTQSAKWIVQLISDPPATPGRPRCFAQPPTSLHANIGSANHRTWENHLTARWSLWWDIKVMERYCTRRSNVRAITGEATLVPSTIAIRLTPFDPHRPGAQSPSPLPYLAVPMLTPFHFRLHCEKAWIDLPSLYDPKGQYLQCISALFLS
jgi:hypothetical protein